MFRYVLSPPATESNKGMHTSGNFSKCPPGLRMQYTQMIKIRSLPWAAAFQARPTDWLGRANPATRLGEVRGEEAVLQINTAEWLVR